MLSGLIWGIFIRIGQSFAESSTTVLCGFLIAGVMRRMIGSKNIRHLFGGPGWRGLLRAWGVGTLLPVCSLGVIPIAREMRRAGVRSGTILAFVLAAPHINPLSLLYGLTLSEPVVVICFAIGSLALAVLAGAVWDRWFETPDDEPQPAPDPTPVPGVKRLGAVVAAAARETVSSTMGFILLGVVFTGLLAGLLPHGVLQQTMKHDDWLAPVEMAGFALPAYLGPLQGMMRLGLMFEHGNSVGASFVLFELGIGINAGLITWLGLLYGWRRILAWLAIITAATLAFAYASERPLYFAKDEANHTHAFDDWTNPFAGGTTVAPRMAAIKIAEKIEVLEPVSMVGMTGLVLLALALYWFDPTGRVENYLSTKPPERAKQTVWNVAVPAPVLGFTCLVGLVVFSIVALYLYYPAPPEAFAEINRVRVEALTAVTSGHKEEAIRQLQHWDLLTRKLQVGVFLRTGRMNAEATRAAEQLRDHLENLRDELLADRLNEAKALVPQVQNEFWNCREAFQPDWHRPVVVLEGED